MRSRHRPQDHRGAVMRISIPFSATGILLVATSAFAQTAPSAAQPRAVTRTLYTRNTELFAEWRPFVVGQATRLTAHLTRVGERFRAFEEGKGTLTFTVGDVKVSAI